MLLKTAASVLARLTVLFSVRITWSVLAVMAFSSCSCSTVIGKKVLPSVSRICLRSRSRSFSAASPEPSASASVSFCIVCDHPAGLPLGVLLRLPVGLFCPLETHVRHLVQQLRPLGFIARRVFIHRDALLLQGIQHTRRRVVGYNGCPHFRKVHRPLGLCFKIAGGDLCNVLVQQQDLLSCLPADGIPFFGKRPGDGRSGSLALRRGEATALTWADVDLADATITVSKGYDFADKKSKNPKTAAGVRVVSIQKVLVDYLKTQQDGCLYVLHNSKGNRMTEQGWKRLWESYMRDLNVKYGYHGKRTRTAPVVSPW